MNVRDFEYIAEIAKQQSMTRAAENLFITQSALSKFLLKCEEELGAQLFLRIDKKLIPTKYGQICIEASRKIIQIHRSMEDEIKDMARSIGGRVRVGFHTSRSDFFFKTVFPAFKSLYPEIEIQVTEADTKRSMEMLSGGEMDFFVSTVWDRRPQYAYDVVCKEEMALAVPFGHPLLTKAVQNECRYPAVRIEEIVNYPLIMMHRDQRTRQYADAYLHRNNLASAVRVVVETRNRSNALLAVANNMGVAFSIDIPLNAELKEQIRYLSLIPRYETPQLELAAVRLKDSYITLAEQAMIQIIRERYLEEYPSDS